MNGKQARKIRRMVSCDLGIGTDCKERGYQETGKRLIGIISHDGNHGSREESVMELRTTEERYLYRELKKIYNRSKINESIRDQLVEDIAELTAKTNGGSHE